MARTLPTPIRVAAGVVGTTLDTLTTLPQRLPALGVSLVGQAFRTSLRVRQELAGLTARGDQLLDGFARHEDKPAWATFDEDETAADSADPADPVGTVDTGAGDATVGDDIAAPDFAAPPNAVPPEPTPPSAPRRRSRVRTTEPLGDVEQATGADAAADLAADLLDGLDSAPRTRRAPRRRATRADHPSGWPDYDLLSVAEVKERLVDTSIDQLHRLLAFEETGPARPAFLTLLANRLATLEAR